MNSHDKKCAPDKQFNDGSCFSIESLKLIATEYNKFNSKNLIKINDDKKYMVKQLTKAFSKICSSQTCWLRTNIVKKINDDEIHTNTFRPSGPSTGYNWLSTTNINDVITQYENKYDDFIFLGALPNDFQELPMLGLSDINFDDFVTEGKTKIGLVINLDTHDKSGSHWVALYTDLKKNQIYYFDSLGHKPGPRIKRFNNKIINYMYKKKYNKELQIGGLLKIIKNKKKKGLKYITLLNNRLNEFNIRYNNIQHQLKDSECGVYSINFIIRSVKGESFDSITKNITSDEQINECRKVYFR
jgi:hypothetical protein